MNHCKVKVHILSFKADPVLEMKYCDISKYQYFLPPLDNTLAFLSLQKCEYLDIIPPELQQLVKSSVHFTEELVEEGQLRNTILIQQIAQTCHQNAKERVITFHRLKLRKINSIFLLKDYSSLAVFYFLLGELKKVRDKVWRCFIRR